MFKKVAKLWNLLRNVHFARSLFVYGVPGAVEHSNIIACVRPRHLIDVGANKGQFALAAFAFNASISVDCFEPLPASATRLERWATSTSPHIRVHRVALAASKGRSEFHVTTREDSSSLFRPGKVQREAGIKIRDTIMVATERLDTQIKAEDILRPCLLKIDVQGGELDVMRGCSNLIKSVDFVYLEVSFIELYENQPLFREVDELLQSYGYYLRGISNAYVDPVQGPMQADALYCR